MEVADWTKARASVAAVYAALTDDVFGSCNDPEFAGSYQTPFGPSQHVYGEVTDTAKITALLGVGREDVFCDLGSGRGQVVLETAAQGVCKSAVGVELVPARAALARAALERLLPDASSSSGARAVLVEGDMFLQRSALVGGGVPRTLPSRPRGASS
jgi:hypothetical protein